MIKKIWRPKMIVWSSMLYSSLDDLAFEDSNIFWSNWQILANYKLGVRKKPARFIAFAHEKSFRPRKFTFVGHMCTNVQSLYVAHLMCVFECSAMSVFQFFSIAMQNNLNVSSSSSPKTSTSQLLSVCGSLGRLVMECSDRADPESQMEERAQRSPDGGAHRDGVPGPLPQMARGPVGARDTDTA